MAALTSRTVTTLVLLLLAPEPLSGQAAAGTSAGEPATWRRWVLGAAGAVVAGLPAYLASGQEGGGLCSGAVCQTSMAAVVGGGIGYLIGRERDEAAWLLRRVGPELAHDSEALELGFRPVRLEARRGGGPVVVGEGGLAVLDGELGAIRRAGAIREIRGATVLPERNAILAATPMGLYAFPLEAGVGMELGQRVHEVRADALTDAWSGEVLAGTAEAVVRLSVSEDGAGWRVVEAAKAPSGHAVSGAGFSSTSGAVWTLEGNVVQGRDGATLVPLGRVVLPAVGRRLAVSGRLGAVAAGGNGVYLLDLADVGGPRLLGRVSPEALRIVLGVAMDGDRLYVAGADQGLVVLDVSDPSAPIVAGVARGIGTADDVAVGVDGVYVLDRIGWVVRRIHFTE